jgi:two-component system, OmpR family, KDP operon response regulator KdpE
MNSERILVVDDEPQITQVVKGSLSTKGYQVHTSNDGTMALAEFFARKPHLVITDLSMPKMNGIALCEAIRFHDETPIIVLSVRDEESVKVQAFEKGADDYVTKPFGMEELLARVKATLRRSSTARSQSNVLQIGPFKIDISAHKCELAGEEIYLTPKEFELFVYFLKNAGKVVTHKHLLLDLWGRAHSDDPDVIRVLVRQLRKKIEPNPSDPTYLKTEPWIGYRFEVKD